MQDQTIQWLSVILGSLLFLDACRWVATRHVFAGRVGGDTPRSCYRNDNRANALVQSRQKGQHMFKFTSLLLPSKSQAHRAETTRREKNVKQFMWNQEEIRSGIFGSVESDDELHGHI